MSSIFIKDILTSLRPKQWIKNLFIFAAIIFGSKFTEVHLWVLAVKTFVAFSAASSAMYLLNDVIDVRQDQQHMKKKYRPIAAGRIKKSSALIMSLLLAASAIALCASVNIHTLAAAIAYIVLQICYSLYLKKIVILDVISIAFGFVFRVIAGVFAIGVRFSPWLILCVFFLTLFLAINKRKNELSHTSSVQTRSVLSSYSLAVIDQMNSIVLPLILTTYTFYTFNSEHSQWLMVTVPIVLYGVFRYLFILQNKKQDDDGPTDDFFSDRSLQITVALWIVVVLVILIYL